MSIERTITVSIPPNIYDVTLRGNTIHRIIKYVGESQMRDDSIVWDDLQQKDKDVILSNITNEDTNNE